jgi:hypothetical protein
MKMWLKSKHVKGDNSSGFPDSTVPAAWSIPTGLRLPARGCEARATLGNRFPNVANPNGVVAGITGGGAQPRWGCPTRGCLTQGSSFLATLGFRTESRWDSQPAEDSR